MLRFGITGNISAGKTAVEKILKEKGYSVLDADDVSHELLSHNKEVIAAFKEFDIQEDGDISRHKLGRIVFHDKVLMRKLESILHPLIRVRINEFFEAHKDEKLVFVSVPLLYEAHMEDLFDKVLLVFAEDMVRYKRLVKRDRLDDEYASVKINSQMSQVEKLILADECIENDGTISELRVRVSYILQGLNRYKNRNIL
mgnify:FL=1